MLNAKLSAILTCPWFHSVLLGITGNAGMLTKRVIATGLEALSPLNVTEARPVKPDTRRLTTGSVADAVPPVVAWALTTRFTASASWPMYVKPPAVQAGVRLPLKE